MMVAGGGGSGGTSYRQSRRGMNIAPQVTLRAKARPAPSYSNYSAPPSTSSGGSYSGGYHSGGGAPSSPSSGNSQGAIGPVGNPGPSAAERRQAAIQARQERRQEMRQDYREKKQDYRSFIPKDETFQSQVSALRKQLEDTVLSNRDQRKNLREDFRLSKERMGDERTRSLDQMMQDYASRNMLNSTEYMDAVGKYDTDYQQKMGDLTRDRDRNIKDLLESLGMYRQSNQNERQNARAEAVRRRAEQFNGWDPSQKPKFMR